MPRIQSLQSCLSDLMVTLPFPLAFQFGVGAVLGFTGVVGVPLSAIGSAPIP